MAMTSRWWGRIKCVTQGRGITSSHSKYCTNLVGNLSVVLKDIIVCHALSDRYLLCDGEDINKVLIGKFVELLGVD